MAEEMSPLHLPHHKENKEEEQHGHGHGHDHNHNQQDNPSYRAMDLPLLAYVDTNTIGLPSAILDKRYEEVTGKKRPDKVVRLISAEQVKEAERREAEERKAEEEDQAAWAKNKSVYHF